MTPEPAFEHGKVKLYTGDALSVLSQLPPDSIDMVLTDPPYSSGGTSSQARTTATTTAKYVQGKTRNTTEVPDFEGDNRDQRSYGFWSTLWLAECYRLARVNSVACIFTDWRQLPITTDALQAAGWIWRGIVVWDKGEGARPQLGRFTNQCEYVVWGSKGKLPLDRGVRAVGDVMTNDDKSGAPSLPGVIDYPAPEEDWDEEPIPGIARHPPIREDQDGKLHIAQKPLLVIVQLMMTSPGGSTILDPFAGSGTTLVAAARLQRSAIGIEVDPGMTPVIAKRIAEETAR